jgi:hypothetical protein
MNPLYQAQAEASVFLSINLLDSSLEHESFNQVSELDDESIIKENEELSLPNFNYLDSNVFKYNRFIRKAQAEALETSSSVMPAFDSTPRQINSSSSSKFSPRSLQEQQSDEKSSVLFATLSTLRRTIRSFCNSGNALKIREELFNLVYEFHYHQNQNDDAM